MTCTSKLYYPTFKFNTYMSKKFKSPGLLLDVDYLIQVD